MDQYKLKQLLENQFRTTYIKLSLLNRNGDILEEIQGRATGGSINIDGASSLRRSCNISLVSEKVDINDYQWALSNLFEVQIGLLDLDGKTINWFPQGVYVINSFNCSLGVNSYNINISGQDKMCQLNGEVSGALTAETDFGEYEEVDGKGNVISKKKLTLREIIWNIVHTYALEPASNIYIDLPDDSGVNLIEYRGDSPLYILRGKETNADTDNSIKNITIYGNQKGLANEEEKKISELNSYWHQGTILDDDPIKGESFEIGGTVYQVQRAEYGDTVGYEKTELTYAGKLVAAAGEAVTSILDKIRDMLGEYEYFYDVHGKFIFQKKKTYLKTLWNNSDFIEIYENGEYSYSFSDLSLFTSVANTPNLKQLKNDYTVWGTRKSITGAELPIHMRLAIDRKPNKYVSPWQIENGQFKQYSVTEYDWRELIYQMAWDYYNHNQDPDFDVLLTAANSSWVTGGRTGYEQYYTDLLGFWRDLYNPDAAEDQEYVKTNYNSSVEKYTHEWKNDLTSDSKQTVPYSSWYIFKDDVRIRWIDSIDLWDKNHDLLEAYTKPDVPFMKTSFEPKSYRFKNSEGKFVTLEDLSKEQEAVKDIINNLYYKDKDNYIKLVQQKEISQVAELSKVVDVYVLKDGATERQKITSFSNDESNETSFEKAYKEVNSPFYYKVDENGSWLELNFNTDRLYTDEAVWPQEADQEWYILKEGQYQLYVNHLLETDKLIEDKLSLPGFEVSLLEQREINRNDLYRKKVEKSEIEGSEESYEIIEYVNFFEDYAEKKEEGFLDICYLDLESDPVLVTDTPQFETYYSTTLHGDLKTDIEYKRLITYYTRISDYYTSIEDISIRYWNKKVIESPEALNFWFDFIDPESVSTMRPFEVQKIGTRSLVKQEKGVKAIYYPKVPEMYFGAAAFQLPKAMEKYFAISSRGQSAFDAINNYLYNHTYITESITISSVPIYHLEPNTKILIDDNERDIKGEYIVDKLTIPLTYNGMMTINATKAPEIY